MRYTIAALALASAAVALPSRIARDNVVQVEQVVQEVQWVTDVVTVQGPAPTPAVASPAVKVQAAPVEAAPTPSVVVKVVTQEPAAPAAASQAPAPAPAASSSQAAAPAASSSSSSSGSGASSSDTQAMLSVINKWRKIFGKSEMTWNDELASNALKTGTDDDGLNENHELNSISLAQVITPGVASCSGTATKCSGLSSGFELAYLAGWMCEDPNSFLAPLCSAYTAAAGMNLSSGEKGHADILNNNDYKRIGCAFANNPNVGDKAKAQWTGLWICDLAL